MFQTITPDKRHQFAGIIDSMHRNRFDVVVGQWGWDIPGIEPCYDKDQFDTEDTVYVVVTDPEHGVVVASSRLNPTTRPHMMSELFSEYCNLQPYPVSETAMECSRFIIDRTLFKDPLLEFKIRCSLGIGITQYCVENNITQLSWLTHQKFYNLATRVWKTEPLGTPVSDTPDGGVWIPAVSKMDRATADLQRQRYENAEEVVAGLIAANAVRPAAKQAA
ncbi:MAG: acyl-homoserine-lactone synthase [Henriciella sp.]|jgi:acyl-homoserine lactone synthase